MTLLNQITYYISRLVAFRISKRGLSLTGLVIMYATMSHFMWWGYIHAATLSKPPSNLGLVAYYSFNEGTGSYAGDSSGKKNTGTLTNGPTWVDGKRGKALNFDGGNDNVNMGDAVEPTNVTVAAWVRPGSTASQMIVSKYGDVGSDNPYELNTTYCRVSDVNDNVDQCNPTVSVQTNQWNFLVGTYNGSSCTIFVNAQNVTNAVLTAATANIKNSATPLRIGIKGSNGTSNPFNGLIDDVRVYNRALSANEIATLYNSGAAKIVKTAVTNPITAKLLASGSGGGASSDVTASFTPSPNALVLAFVYTLADTAQVPTMSGNGLTWDRIFGPFAYTESGTVSVFRAMGAAPSSGAATISYSVTSSSGRWVIIEFANVDTKNGD